MIKYISSPDLNVTVSGQVGPYRSGAVYWDGNAQKFKVIDSNGGSEDFYGASVNIDAGQQFRDIQSWVLKKQAEERELAQLCKEYPNLEEARKEFEMIKQLVKEYK
jgi:hypothetical protein